MKIFENYSPFITNLSILNLCEDYHETTQYILWAITILKIRNRKSNPNHMTSHYKDKCRDTNVTKTDIWHSNHKYHGTRVKQKECVIKDIAYSKVIS